MPGFGGLGGLLHGLDPQALASGALSQLRGAAGGLGGIGGGQGLAPQGDPATAQMAAQGAMPRPQGNVAGMMQPPGMGGLAPAGAPTMTQDAGMQAMPRPMGDIQGLTKTPQLQAPSQGLFAGVTPGGLGALGSQLQGTKSAAAPPPPPMQLRQNAGMMRRIDPSQYFRRG